MNRLSLALGHLSTPIAAKQPQSTACLTFTDSKRPITVELLQRLNLRATADDAGLAEAWAAARNRGVHYSGQPTSMQAEFPMERPAK